MTTIFEKGPERRKLEEELRQEARSRLAHLERERDRILEVTQTVDIPRLQALKARLDTIGEPDELVRRAETESKQRIGEAGTRMQQASEKALAANKAVRDVGRETGISSPAALETAKARLAELASQHAQLDEQIARYERAQLELRKHTEAAETATRAVQIARDEGARSIGAATETAKLLSQERAEIEAEIQKIGDPLARRRDADGAVRQAKRDAGL